MELGLLFYLPKVETKWHLVSICSQLGDAHTVLYFW